MIIEKLNTLKITLAQAVDISPLPNSGNKDYASSMLDTAFMIVLSVVSAVCLLLIVIAGLKYILAQGNPEEMSKAKNTIIYALLGLTVVASAFLIVSFVVKGVG